jgi:hypothetical protein
MKDSAIGVPSRLAFLVCGTISILIGNLYRSLTLAPGPVGHSKWDLSSVALMAVGGFAVAIALLPGSWIKSVRKIGPNNQQTLTLLLKMLGGFAAFSYLLTIGAFFAPLSGHPSPWVVFFVCPAWALMLGACDSVGTVVLLVAPVDAAVYGALGATFGFLLVVFRRFQSHARFLIQIGDPINPNAARI